MGRCVFVSFDADEAALTVAWLSRQRDRDFLPEPLSALRATLAGDLADGWLSGAPRNAVVGSVSEKETQ